MAASLEAKIEAAFAGRAMPAEVIDPPVFQFDDDVEEAQWFAGRDWHSLTWADWQEHRSAIFFFSPQAFAYYLPSLLLLSLGRPGEDLAAADTLTFLLDLSPSIEGWPDSTARLLFELRAEELGAVKEWLLFMCDYPTYSGYGISGSGPGDRFGRAFEAMDLLQQEIERKRREDSRVPDSPMDRA